MNIVFSQRYSSELWHYGEVLKKDSTIERGKLFYSFSEEQVQIQTPSKLKVYHAKDILKFRFTDSLTNELREVKTMKYKTGDDYYIPGFFEILEHKTEPYLFKREYISEYAVNDGVTGFVSYQKILEVDYFYTKNGVLHFLPTKSKKFFELFEGKAMIMKAYSKKNKLRISREADVIALFHYYYKIK